MLALTVAGNPVFAADDAKDAPPTRGFNVYVNPLGFLLGSYNGALHVGITDRFVLGPSISYARYGSSVTINGVTTSTSSTTLFGAGLDLAYFLGHSRFTTGFYTDLGINYSSYSSTTSLSTLAIAANIGYWWFFDGGINLGLAIGLNYALGSLSVFSISNPAPNFAFNIGYSF